jgi:integrase/recombinase XerD
VLLKFAIKDFLDDREFKNLSKVTLAGYKLTLNEFHDYCVEAGVVDVTDLTPTTVKGTQR